MTGIEQLITGILGLCFCSYVIYVIGYINGCDKYKYQAIERGLAIFDAKTGEWRWKDAGE